MVLLMPISHANEPTLQTQVQDTGELDRQDGPSTLVEPGELFTISLQVMSYRDCIDQFSQECQRRKVKVCNTRWR